MKKLISILTILCLVILLGGCQKEKTKIKIMYGVLSIAYSSEEQEKQPYLDAVQRLNETLAKQQLPFEVEMDFVIVDQLSTQDDNDIKHYYDVLEDKMKQQEAYDLIYIPILGGSRFTLQDIISKGYIDCMNDYLLSDNGTEIINAYPKNVLDSLKVNHDYYLLPTHINQSTLVDMQYYTYDQDILHQMNIQTKGKHLWEDADEIINAYQQEENVKYGLMGTSHQLFAYQEGYVPLEGDSILKHPFVYNEEKDEIQFILDVEDFQYKRKQIQKLYDAQQQSMILKEGYLYYKDDNNHEIQIQQYLINGIEMIQPQVVDVIKNDTQFAYGGIGVASWSQQKAEAYHFLKLLATNQEVNQALKSKGELTILGNVFQSEYQEIEGITLPYQNQEEFFHYVEQLPTSKMMSFSFDTTLLRKEYQDIMKYYLDYNHQNIEECLQHFDKKERLIYESLGLDKVLEEMNKQYQIYQKQLK